MGFLSSGFTLTWEQVIEHIPYIKEHGIKQFLNIWNKEKNRENDILKWGDEIEYIIVQLDHENKRATLSLRGDKLLEKLQEPELKFLETGVGKVDSLWRPEYGSFMVEGTPGEPYIGKPEELLLVEKNMEGRRREVENLLLPNEILLSLTHFPLLGVSNPHFTTPPFSVNGPIAQSFFIPDQLIHPHPRFATLTENIRKRKGKKVGINIPLFFDEKTEEPKRYNESKEEQKEGHIYCDAMGFGMGSCCVQCTYQCCNIKEARIIYDQFVVLAPLMMALSGACAVVRGMLSDHDVRWKIISESVDDRTDNEKHEKEEKKRINKSRYSSVSCYISPVAPFSPKYNDITIVKNEEVYEKLVKEEGMDELLAQHISHLWIRDPLVVYSDKIEIEDEKQSDHFENIQSTNWQTVRFKPPPPNSKIGWRVEFRSMELQLTDFENAAFVTFITLLVRVLPLFDLNLYIPISLVDENMERGFKRGAVLNQKFFWRKYPLLSNIPQDDQNVNKEEIIELSLNEIINGCDHFPGFIKLIHLYLDTVNVDDQVRNSLQPYFNLISKRASGELMTCASYVRHFVKNHPSYKNDSIVNQQINYDLIVHLHQISTGILKPSLKICSFSSKNFANFIIRFIIFSSNFNNIFFSINHSSFIPIFFVFF
eukprot:TRINITY_DN1483_c0_g2_i1.p1 TRINITY_DN1483_c0_g2~~TRINITY_DN1483_c0_g2_i1.p1  ORF type:complete len:652 (+),score=178.00 TRINITY_DN1483_c0_g2_i1:63-2018(+)